jgi:hypothetical protein
MIAVLRAARELLARPENDFSWSSWEDASDAFYEIDNLIVRFQVGNLPGSAALTILFLPTGPMQEVSLSSGWGDEFCQLADRFDAALVRVYPPAASSE